MELVKDENFFKLRDMNKVKLMSESTLQDVEYITEQNEDEQKKL